MGDPLFQTLNDGMFNCATLLEDDLACDVSLRVISSTRPSDSPSWGTETSQVLWSDGIGRRGNGDLKLSVFSHVLSRGSWFNGWLDYLLKRNDLTISSEFCEILSNKKLNTVPVREIARGSRPMYSSQKYRERCSLSRCILVYAKLSS